MIKNGVVAALVAATVGVLGLSAPAHADSALHVPVAPVSGMSSPAGSAGVKAAKGQPPRASSKSARLTGCTTCFYYVVGSEDVSALTPTVAGAQVNADTYKPLLNTSKGGKHTLAELAVQDNSGNVIEVGWNVDQSVNGDLNAHLFTFWWKAGVPQAYNANLVTTACGISTPSATAGQTLVTSNASPILLKTFTIFHSGSYWYLGYGPSTSWFACLPDSLWSGAFTSAKYVQDFGEIASTHDSGAGVKPCEQMGSGVNPNVTTTGAARFGNMTYLDSTGVAVGTPSQFQRQDVGTGGTVDNDYQLKSVNARSFYYGGSTSAGSPTC